MNALGWILIFLLILVIGAGIFLLVWYLVKIRKTDSTSPTGPAPPSPPPPAPVTRNLSILTGAGKPEYGITTDAVNAVIVRDPQGPVAVAPVTITGPTGAGILPVTVPLPNNLCSRYDWTYNGGTGTIGPTGPTGPTGTSRAAIITGGTGGYLRATWNSNNYLIAGSPLTVGPTGTSTNERTTWIFIPDTPGGVSGKWCLQDTSNGLFCMHYNIGFTGPTGTGQYLTLKEFRVENTTDANDKGFVFNNNVPLSSNTTPTCNAG